MRMACVLCIAVSVDCSMLLELAKSSTLLRSLLASRQHTTIKNILAAVIRLVPLLRDLSRGQARTRCMQRLGFEKTALVHLDGVQELHNLRDVAVESGIVQREVLRSSCNCAHRGRASVDLQYWALSRIC